MLRTWFLQAILLMSTCGTGKAHLSSHVSTMHHLGIELTQTDIDPSISLHASPDVIKTDRALVTVSWSGMIQPRASDWIGVYAPVTNDFSSAAPIKLQMASSSKSHMPSGAGNVTFALLNMRSNYVFALFRGGSGPAEDPHFMGPYQTAVAVSNVVVLTETLQDSPSGIHLALTGVPDEMTVMWTTKTIGKPSVQWGQTSEQIPTLLDHSDLALTTTYSDMDMCPGGPAVTVGYRPVGQIHRATLRGLKPSTNYSYRVGDVSLPNKSFSDVFSFMSAPLPSSSHAAASSPSGGVRLLAFGDMGTNEEAYDASTNGGHAEGDNTKTVPLARALLEQVVANTPPPGITAERLQEFCGARQAATGTVVSPWWCARPTAMLHIGDLSYAVGFSSEWDEWMSQIQPYAARIPLMVSLGNHERNWNGNTSSSGDPFPWGSIRTMDSGGECGIPTETRFSMPGNWGKRWGTKEPGVWGTVDRSKQAYNDEPWYGFVYGPIFIYMASSEHDVAPGSRQHSHMDKTLRAVNRTETPWVIVTFHRMIYCSSTGDGPPDSDQAMQRWLRASVEPLLMKHNVNLVFTGHHHSFQRTCRVFNGTCLGSSADQHVQAPIHIVMGTGGTGLSQNLQTPPPPWLEYANAQHWGYCRLWANHSALSLDWVLLTDGQVADRLWLEIPKMPDSDVVI